MFVNHRLSSSREFNFELSSKKRRPVCKMRYPTLSIDDLEKKKTKLYRFLTLDKFEKLMTEHKLFLLELGFYRINLRADFRLKNLQMNL